MIKIGTDICNVRRVSRAYSRFGRRFLNRILTPSEIAYVTSQPRHTVDRIAGRFAAKEAAVKALGTGWRGVSWKEIEITREKSGRPTITLHGRAARIASEFHLDHWEVSLSHDTDYAQATVIAYKAS